MTAGGDPIGYPALYVMMAGFLLFVAALLSARRNVVAEERGNVTRSRRSMAGIVVQGLAIGITSFGPLRITLDPWSSAAIIQAIACALLMATTITLFVWSSRTMGRNWSIVARTRSDHELVRTGPFAYLRHPIYTALFPMMLALAIGFGHAGRLWWTIPFYALGTWLRTSEEERLLRAKFGGAYDDYAKQVRRFIPGVF